MVHIVAMLKIVGALPARPQQPVNSTPFEMRLALHHIGNEKSSDMIDNAGSVWKIRQVMHE
ncbi:hypothetical protein A3724_10545 [Alcanivorax sp. HI0033]|nr:hypothetical protein A3713_08130 [Alcanivorax sp. HI0003]KZX68935.1 hypothetical protein A3714_08250 [Alcanivorax sp. HI0007]KZX73670.1 hypothetical protein A3716_13270 [Alcanivorax sp. HI0011]KZX77596.1 hypothetical protein A3717_12025 [Alcanivorax sp. HI0013]KZY11929.1 hypothetical protein A3724_10545 [Alcanivorax sp. HI0033]KZY12459.1 hypothetical protein A3725_13810 [Alcanivorax sp. HI0035]